VNGAWVAAAVRGRGLTRRVLTEELLTRLARSATLQEALALLSTTAYWRDAGEQTDLLSAQRAVSSTLLWHLRVLAGWGPPMSAGPLRALAAEFEIANVAALLVRLGDRAASPAAPFDLGSLATAWASISRGSSPEEVRRRLAASAWGDPGSADLGTVRLSMQLAAARMMLDEAPGASTWAAGRAAIVAAKVVLAGATPALGERARRDADRLLGRGWQGATSIAELATRLRPPAAHALRGASGAGDLWLAERAWWALVAAEAGSLARRSPPGPEAVVGVAGLLAADAWRTSAALATAAAGGRAGGGAGDRVLDGLA
jgi:hypothetical protein